MGGSKGGRDMAEVELSKLDVATSLLRSRHGWQRLSGLDVATSLRGRDMGSGVGRRNGVATPFGGRDLEWLEWCRDADLMWRHDSGCLDVATSK